MSRFRAEDYRGRKKKRASSRPRSAYLSLGVRRTTPEVFRQLYADGTPEKIWLSLDASDFENAEYADFLVGTGDISPQRLWIRSARLTQQRSMYAG
ncbi:MULTISPECIES: hypothetical protein [Bradyrhizobium]|uniref:Uncharacterized protein n=1 Tax=Bradyrhizobium elkanii TaxID=29448 RepID=A0A8I1Y5P4_BRAEL|nr:MULTISPECIES: hypothetical protein [Bradyrhizobium]MBP1293657.1 hypothetical protein [Bradyrhizobium elkanii]NWL43090.1 hypothetical protein [Bradyrhizobium elkanii]RYM33123.1 hypothetical protein EWH13_01340 [Bradyrhizobium elkanii]WLB10822.1 hypothetical protein QIH87_06690 [Bradyrhizobium elkanii]WLB71420.1 hypothetical protein QIH89_40545 [Bradyrhizobium elkanii]